MPRAAKKTNANAKTTMLAVRFPNRIVDEITALAKKNNAYKSEVVVELVKRGLEKTPDAKLPSVLD